MLLIIEYFYVKTQSWRQIHSATAFYVTSSNVDIQVQDTVYVLSSPEINILL